MTVFVGADTNQLLLSVQSPFQAFESQPDLFFEVRHVRSRADHVEPIFSCANSGS